MPIQLKNYMSNQAHLDSEKVEDLVPPPSRRRTLAVEGCVEFPVYKTNSREGGMFVKLWVLDSRPFGESYGVCCGTSIHEIQQEVLIGSDRLKRPVSDIWEKNPASVPAQEWQTALDKEQKDNEAFEEFFYPVDCENGDKLSTGLLADILMGSTGWSGDFLCTYEDLTAQGKAIYDSMKALYPKAELHLVTFLDT